MHESNRGGASPRHRRATSSPAWRWGLSQTPDSLVDFHTGEEGAKDESKGESKDESKGAE